MAEGRGGSGHTETLDPSHYEPGSSVSDVECACGAYRGCNRVASTLASLFWSLRNAFRCSLFFLNWIQNIFLIGHV